eukprot:3919383-Rhodomonas_salina.1
MRSPDCPDPAGNARFDTIALRCGSVGERERTSETDRERRRIEGGSSERAAAMLCEVWEGEKGRGRERARMREEGGREQDEEQEQEQEEGAGRQIRPGRDVDPVAEARSDGRVFV